MYISRKRLLIMSITILMMILFSSIFGATFNNYTGYDITNYYYHL